MGAQLAPIRSTSVQYVDDVDRSLAALRAMGSEVGASADLVEHMCLVAAELGHNVVRHGGGGTVEIRTLSREGVVGIEVLARDFGGGIVDPTQAFGGVSSGTGLGAGLGTALRFSHELFIDSRVGDGTRIWSRRFDGTVSTMPQFAIVGRPFPGEGVSGDDALLVPRNEEVLFAICDGLGHGPDARIASKRAIEAVSARLDSPIPVLIEHADVSSVGTRGAVISVGRYHHPGRSLEVAGLGNVNGEVWSRRGIRSHVLPRGGMLGGRTRVSQGPSPHAVARHPGDIVLLFSDGLRSSIAVPPAMWAMPAVVIAHQLLMTHCRDNDDATILVIK